MHRFWVTSIACMAMDRLETRCFDWGAEAALAPGTPVVAEKAEAGCIIGAVASEAPRIGNAFMLSFPDETLSKGVLAAGKGVDRAHIIIFGNRKRIRQDNINGMRSLANE